MMKVVLILGSAPNVVTARDWPKDNFDKIVAINNAWKVHDNWDDLIFAYDFEPARRPIPNVGQNFIDESKFVPLQNSYGGFVYAGGTMAFTAAYWALGHYRPDVIGFLGCDMVYDQENHTHFYGTGSPDPLRDDISLRDLGAKSARFRIVAARQACAVVNLSPAPSSALLYPRARHDQLAHIKPLPFDPNLTQQAFSQEEYLDYYVPSGRYWLEKDRFEPSAIDALDALWREAAYSLPKEGA